MSKPELQLDLISTQKHHSFNSRNSQVIKNTDSVADDLSQESIYSPLSIIKINKKVYYLYFQELSNGQTQLEIYFDLTQQPLPIKPSKELRLFRPLLEQPGKFTLKQYYELLNPGPKLNISNFFKRLKTARSRLKKLIASGYKEWDLLRGINQPDHIYNEFAEFFQKSIHLSEGANSKYTIEKVNFTFFEFMVITND